MYEIEADFVQAYSMLSGSLVTMAWHGMAWHEQVVDGGDSLNNTE
jgi:hypothetical protein